MLLDTLPPAHFRRHPLPDLAPTRNRRGTALPQGVDNPTNVRRFDGADATRVKISPAQPHRRRRAAIARKIESLHEEGEQPGQHGAGDQRRPIPGIQSEETTVCRNAHSHGTLLLFAGSCFR